MTTNTLSIAIVSLFHHASSQMLGPMSYPGAPPIRFPAASMPFPVPMPGMLPSSAMHMPAPMPIAVQQPKLPVVIMPFYSKNNKALHRKYRRRKRIKKFYRDSSLSDSDVSSDSSSSSDLDFRAQRSKSSKIKKRRQVLTPVVSYVTKDGYVVYQKKIKRDKARDWLQIGRKSGLHHESSEGTDKRKKQKPIKDLKKKITSKFLKKKRDYD